MPAPKAGALPLGYTPIPDMLKSLEDTTSRLTAQLLKKCRSNFRLSFAVAKNKACFLQNIDSEPILFSEFRRADLDLSKSLN